VKNPGRTLIRYILRILRRCMVGPKQQWLFTPPPADWAPPRVDRTSLYLHVPFCRNSCPYCPYTKVKYKESLVEPYTQAALAEVDWWADWVGPAELTSVYIGGGTPTLALDSVASVIDRAQERFSLTGDIGIETNPSDVNHDTVRKLQDLGVGLVSLGVQSFCQEHLDLLGRRYRPQVAERALGLLADGGFASVNVDLMFALPGQSVADVIADLEHAVDLGADQVTTYPLFTFPYTSVGSYLKLKDIRMPELHARRRQYRAIHQWCTEHGFARVSVWGFRRGGVPCYSSVTRDGYIGIGPGAGSQFPQCFVLNTFDLDKWRAAANMGQPTTALYMPFVDHMAGWWWLYWRFYDTRIPLSEVDALLGADARKARWLLSLAQSTGLATRNGDTVELTESGAFWLHLAQNYLALDYVNQLWTAGRREAWPGAVRL